MILPFSTKLNGKPTHFVEKVIKSIGYISASGSDKEILRKAVDLGHFDFEVYDRVNPKHHTIRDDKTDRWHAGKMIDYFINNRMPDMFRFAPRMPCISTQKIQIQPVTGWAKITVDGKLISDDMMLQLALNDGFETIDDFFMYFSRDYQGKIIHWTDLKY